MGCWGFTLSLDVQNGRTPAKYRHDAFYGARISNVFPGIQRHFSRTDTVGAYHSRFLLAYQRARIWPKRAKTDRTSETPWVANSCRELLGQTLTLVRK